MNAPLKDEYAFYRACLRGDTPDRNDGPQPGRYKIPARRTDGAGYKPAQTTPVAIWPEGNATIIKIRNKVLRPSDGDDYYAFGTGGWHKCVAISEEEYQSLMTGGPAAGEHEAVTRSNQAPPDDTVEAITERIDDLAREAELLIAKGPAQTQEECDRAADLANHLGKWENRSEELRVVEKAPVLQQGRDIDARWDVPKTKARTVKERLKAMVCSPFMKELKRQLESARFQALTTGTPDAEIPQQKVTAGSRGRPMALRTFKRAEITDKAALVQASMDHPKLIAALQEIADAAARANITLPGMKIVTEEKAA